MTPELIERLKERAPNVCDPACRGRCPACPMELMLDAAAELSRLRQSEAELRRDAEKYRYMRDNAPKEGVTVKFRPEGDSITWGVVPEADAIDAERYRWLKGQVHMGVVADNGQRFNAKLLDGHRDGNRILCSFILRHGAASAFATPKYRDLDAAIDAALGETKK